MMNTNLVHILLINIILLLCCPQALAYRQVAGGGDSSGNGDGPKIYKAVNFDLIFPKSFNSSENVISTTPESIPSPPKATVVGEPFYPLSKSNESTTHNTAADAPAVVVNERQPTLYVTLPPLPVEALGTTSNEVGTYEKQQNTNGNNYNYNNTQAVTQNPINIQQQQYEQKQQLNVINKTKMEPEQQEQQQQHQQQIQNLATGRAVDNHSGYPFGQLITPLIKNAPRLVYRQPVTSYSSFPLTSSSLSSSSVAKANAALSPSNVGNIIYPKVIYQRKPPNQAEIDKLRGKGSFRDRFSPSEGVASLNFRNNHNHDHSHNHNNAPFLNSIGKTPFASNTVKTFVAPNNLYSFPPNNINYPPQTQDTKIGISSTKVNSYSPPPSGPLKNTNYNLYTANSNSNPYKYNGPVNTSYLTPLRGVSGGDDSSNDSKYNDGEGDGDIDTGTGDDSVGVLPASAMDQSSGGNVDMGENSSEGGNMAISMNAQDGSFKDRFTPSEGVATQKFKLNHDHPHDNSNVYSYNHPHNHHNHASSYTTVGETPSAHNTINSYMAANNLFSFPPNNINYPYHVQDTKAVIPKEAVNSYSPAPSGPLKDSSHNSNVSNDQSNPYQYNGHVSMSYLPPSKEDDGGENGSNDSNSNKNNNINNNNNNHDNGASNEDENNGASYDSVGVLPASDMDQNADNNIDTIRDMGDQMDDHHMDFGDMKATVDSNDDNFNDDVHSYDTGKEYPTPPPGWLKNHPETAHDHPPYDHHPKQPSMEFEHSQDHHHQSDIILDHDHIPYHHSYASIPSYPVYHSYPHIIYDDHQHDHHIHVEHPHLTTTRPPPPPPPPEPRVKKYSYFYIGRKLWYIPLYFTVWFSFYVLWLILKSIARHKVNLPNHYVARRSVMNYDINKTQKQTINQLTVSILDKIETFKRKYSS